MNSTGFIAICQYPYERQERIPESTVAHETSACKIFSMANTLSQLSRECIPEMGITHEWQSLFLLPSEYVDLSNVIEDFSLIKPRSSRVLISAEVVTIARLDKLRKPTRNPYPAILVLGLSDGKSVIECEIFRASDWMAVEIGDKLTILATVKSSSFRPLHLVAQERAAYSPIPRVDYTGISGKISGAVIGFHAQQAVSKRLCINEATHWLRSNRPVLAKLVSKHWGNSIESLLLSLHSPKSIVEGERALAFARRLCMAEIRYNGRLNAQPKAWIEPCRELRSQVWEALRSQPETPSKGQLEALKVAVPALSQDSPGRVLINGDVGSGKTLVFLAIVAAFAQMEKPCAIMAPTETVAAQIYQQFKVRYPNLACKYVGGNAKRSAEPALVWIGTTALLFADNRPEFACVVVDEQHKCSREQREGLLSPHSHLIEASATPIPRSLAVALFDGFTFAKISNPPVNKKIRSHLISESERGLVKAMHRKAINEGQRVIYLYAAVKEGKTAEAVEDAQGSKIKENVRAAKVAFKEMDAAFPNQVAMVHGQMPSEKVATELEQFRSGEKPILVASTAIEVGMDVKDVRLLVVSNADRFGLAQLHQIRGRLARNGGEADFVMHTKKALTKNALERLNAVKTISDGFRLAEKDLEIRGFGEVAGDIQSGSTKTTFMLSKITAADFLRLEKR